MRTTARLSLVMAVIVAATLVSVPAAGAKARTSVTPFEKKQNAAIKRANRRITRAGNRITFAGTRIDGLNTLAQELVSKNAAQDESFNGVKSAVDTIVAGVPAIVDGLTQLKDGLVTIQGVLEGTVAPALTALNDGLVKLGGAYQAVEYGVARVSATNATVAAGSLITSADVPDDGNAAVANGTAILVATGSPVAVDLKADIRSNEGDNVAGGTVGQAGGFVYVKGTQQTFTDNDADVDPGGGVVAANRDGQETVVQRVACIGAPNPPGIFGTVAGENIVTPTGTVTNLSLRNLPGGIVRTDTTHPDASSPSLLPAACQFAATPGAVYEVYYNVNFVDIPTSTTPGPTE
jgi:hypothetical protein